MVVAGRYRLICIDEFHGSNIAVGRQADVVIWFDFAALCEIPRSRNDYLELERSYPTLILSNVPLPASASSRKTVIFRGERPPQGRMTEKRGPVERFRPRST